MLDSPSHLSEYDSQVLKQGPFSTGPRRRRTASTSLPLLTLCTFNPDHYSPSITSQYSDLDLIFHCHPATPHLFGFEELQQQQPTKSLIPQQSPQPQLQAPPYSRGAPTNGGVIDTLPSELLCLIFESYLEPSSSSTVGAPPEIDPYTTHTTSPHGFFSISREYIRTPIPLTHVCRSWRYAAIGHTRLWSSVAFSLANGRSYQDAQDEAPRRGFAYSYADGFEDFEFFTRGKLQLLNLFLRRAGDAPLSISFSASVLTSTSCWSFNRDFRLVHEALELICLYSRTWKALRIELDQGWCIETFLELLVRSPAVVGGGFDRLQSLHLELLAANNGGDSEDHERSAAVMHSRLMVKDIYRVLLQRAPGLTDITLDREFFLCAERSKYDACPSYQSRCPWDDIHRDDEFVPWTQLKNLTIQSPTITTRTVLDVCSRASNLEMLNVRRVAHNFKAGQLYRPSSIVLRHLRSLDVTFVSEPQHFFAPLALGPRLESVKVIVSDLPSRVYLRGRGSQRRYPLKKILEPVDRMLAAAPSSSRRKVEVRCSVKKSCVQLDGSELDAVTSASAVSVDEQWMEENGLNALVGCGGKRVVEVYDC
ncbi:hypothetical protein EST38_g10117 [Candolleomyces aberdarensis]|uniref:Uncharacterized protein n=1 Tax=Candolleomyces aberdarensis TaxID=2316362 RepID=A0A4Q2DAM9_9AGAR|nr:hypothetical protein EST38_g10117 [Candolleomyces aberdarensis]